jgi:transposase InsO family protein
MPWKVSTLMDERIKLVARGTAADANISALCREFGISRPTAYRWLKRYDDTKSLTDLRDQSRRPHHSPLETAVENTARVVSLRQQYGWGGKKLQVLLQAEGITLSLATINRIIARQGLVLAKNSHAPATQRFARATPNELWQMDFKGQVPMASGHCYPLTLLDDHSRFVVGLFALTGTTTELVWPCLEGTFRTYGLPAAMLTDHGQPWYDMSNGYGLTTLAVRLIKQGIDLIHSRIAHPQTQGKIERFHRTLKDEMYRQPVWPADLAAWAALFVQFRQAYNTVRPHEALAMQTPAACYRTSSRSYVEQPAAWVYPPHVLVRTVDRLGMVSYEGHRYFVCEALLGESVGLEPIGQSLLVHYRQMYVRDINLATKRSAPLVWPVRQTRHPVAN